MLRKDTWSTISIQENAGERTTLHKWYDFYARAMQSTSRLTRRQTNLASIKSHPANRSPKYLTATARITQMRFMDKQHWDACNIIYQGRLYHDLNMELDATTESEIRGFLPIAMTSI